MSGRDAFEDEMGFLRRISAEDGERLLSNPGLNGGEATELQEVAAFVRALPAAVSTQPDPGIEGVLVARLAATAHAATREAHATATSEVPVAGPGWAHERRLLVLASVASRSLWCRPRWRGWRSPG